MPPRAAGGRLESRPSPTPPGAPLAAGVSALDLDGRAEALLAVPDGHPGPRPLLVFCHGAGGTSAQSLAAVGDLATARGVLVLATTSADSTWDLLAGGLGRDVAVLDAALERVFAAQPVSRVAIGGFSDGASYALSLGLANGDFVTRVIAFSPGFVAPGRRRGRPPVFVSHGIRDRVLPIDRTSRRLVPELRRAGHEVTYREFPGGHGVPRAIVAEAVGGL